MRAVERLALALAVTGALAACRSIDPPAPPLAHLVCELEDDGVTLKCVPAKDVDREPDRPAWAEPASRPA
jgi:hypothetical protein